MGMQHLEHLYLLEYVSETRFRTTRDEARPVYLTSADAEMVADTETRLVHIKPHNERTPPFVVVFELVRSMGPWPFPGEAIKEKSPKMSDAEVEKAADLLCDTCGFIAKSGAGLAKHVSSKHGAAVQPAAAG